MGPYSAYLLAVGLLSLVLLACGGGSKAPERGASSGEAATRQLLDSLARNDKDSALAVIDRDYAGQALNADTFGAGAQALAALLADRGQQATVAFRDLTYRAEPRRGSETYAEVFVSGRMNAAGRDVALADARVLTAEIGGRWYVTGAEHPYWKAVIEAEQRAASQPTAYMIAEQDSSPNLPGIYVPPHLGPDQQRGTSDDRTHVANGVNIPICTPEQNATPQPPGTLCYPSNPPTSGPHAQSALNFRVHDTPQPKENLVHNMEHGGVIIWYNSTNISLITLA
jgi:hypothetical protein